MALKTYQRASSGDNWDWEAVRAWLATRLQAQGVAIGDRGIGTAIEDVNGVPAQFVYVDLPQAVTNAQLATVLDPYTPPASTDPLAAVKQEAKARFVALKAKTAAERQAVPLNEDDLFLLLKLIRATA